MADTREVRALLPRSSSSLDAAVAADVRRWARAHLAPDPHGAGEAGDEYLTTSVYFDTEQLDVFHRRGSFGRSKYRIRRYGCDEVVFLERKLREPAVLAKRRTMAPLTALHRLTGIDPRTSWPGDWFQARLVARRLRPVCQVSYRRTARIGTAGGSLIRLTIDDGLAAQPSRRLSTSATNPAFPRSMAARFSSSSSATGPPAIFKRLVEEFALTPEPASKYRLGMSATGQARQTDLQLRPAADDAADADAVHV